VLSNAVNATIGDGTGVGTIGNDDVAPTPRCPNRCWSRSQSHWWQWVWGGRRRESRGSRID